MGWRRYDTRYGSLGIVIMSVSNMSVRVVERRKAPGQPVMKAREEVDWRGT